jgi:hypothetical protein
MNHEHASAAWLMAASPWTWTGPSVAPHGFAGTEGPEQGFEAQGTPYRGQSGDVGGAA